MIMAFGLEYVFGREEGWKDGWMDERWIDEGWMNDGAMGRGSGGGD